MADEHKHADSTPPLPPEGVADRSADLRADAAEHTPPSAVDPTPRSHGARTARGILAWVLVVLTSVVVAVAALGIWANEVLLDTNRFVSIVEPISRDPAVDAAISARTSDELVRALRIQERAEEVLPQRAGFLSYTLQEAAQRIIEEQIRTLISREGVQSAWLSSIRFAHQEIVTILRDQNPTIVSQDGVVSLNLFPLIQAALQRLEGTGLLPDRFSLPTLTTTSPDEARQQLSSALGVPLPSTFGVIPVAEAPQLEKAQNAVAIFDTLVVVIPLIAVLLAVVAIALSLNRRRTVVALGVGIGAGIVILGLVGDLLGQEAVNAVRDRPEGIPVVQATVDSLTENLWQFLRPAIVVAFVLAGVAFLAGRSAWFVAAGATARPAGRWLLSSRHVVADYADALRIAGVVLALAALFLLNLSWGTLLLVLLALLAYMVAVTLIATRWGTAQRSTPAP